MQSPAEKQRTTVGRKVTDKDFKVKILDQNGNEVPTGQVGQIVIKTPLQMINYLSNMNDKPIDWIYTEDTGTER